MGRDGSGVQKASESTIEISFAYKGQRCRERVPLKPTSANIKKAIQHRHAILQAIEDGVFNYLETFPDSPRAKVFAESPAVEPLAPMYLAADYLKDWLQRQSGILKASAFNDYRKIVKYQLTPWFGHLSLIELSRPVVQEALGRVNAGNKRLANIQSVLRKALSDSMYHNPPLIERNPLDGWCYQKNELPTKASDVDPFTIDEQGRIIDAATGQGKNLIQFALWTGMRTSELVALNWSDIDWGRGCVVVERAKTQSSEEAETTKTRAGKREIKLLSMALKALSAQKEHTFLAGAEIFQNPNTLKRWDGDQPIRRTMWTPALKKAGVRYRRPYQTRHTYASMMLSAGEHPMWVARQMGHANWTMIAQIYGKWMPDADPFAGGRAEEKFNPERPVFASING